MKIMIGALVVSLLAATAAIAQSASGIPIGTGPGGVPFGAGTQRGLQALNNSGQNGFVTVFDRGTKTAVVVAIDGGNGHAQRAAIVRGHSCDALGSVAFPLTNLHAKISRGYVPVAKARLLSGNYVAVVYANATPKARPIACGELYN